MKLKDNTKVSYTENKARGIFGIFNMTFLSSKKPPFEKIISPNDAEEKTQKNIWNF